VRPAGRDRGRRARGAGGPGALAATNAGYAVVGTIVVLALLAVAAAGTLVVTQGELWSAGRARSRVQARYTAEAGVRHAVALLAPGTTFAPVVAAQGGVLDAGAPGPLPFPGGGWTVFPGPPYGYGVTPSLLPAAGGPAGERLLLLARATAVRGAERTMAGTVGRAPEPYAPAALAVGAGGVALEGAAVASAGDPARVVLDATSAETGQVAVAAATEAQRAAALEAIAAGGGALLGAHASAPLLWPDVASYAAGTGIAAADPATVAMPVGTVAAPAAARLSAGTLASLSGYGAIVASGDLELHGAVDWSGALVVGGTLTVDAGPCRLAGIVFAHGVRFRSACTVRFDGDSVRMADGALRLPRAAVLLALVDA